MMQNDKLSGGKEVEMYSVKEVIIVEGKYDKHKLSGFVDATIIETKGFGFFSDKEKVELIRRLAEKRGVIILTDSDGAGFVIRNKLKGILNGCNVKNAYIPDIFGKEKRKEKPSKEGKLGVEGMPPDVLLDALVKCGATIDNLPPREKKTEITKTDLFKTGLTGREGSRERRADLLKKLALPERMTSNALLDVLNVLYTKEEFFNAAACLPCTQNRLPQEEISPEASDRARRQDG